MTQMARDTRPTHDGRVHWDGCATSHISCAIMLLRDVLVALLKEDSPQVRASAEKILADTKCWHPTQASPKRGTGPRLPDQGTR
jgi:hypothetical protein